MFQNILFPFDGTARCMLAAPEIVQLVKRSNGQLDVLYVNQGVVTDVLAFEDLQTEIRRLWGTEEDIPEPSFHVTEGKPDDAILRFAEDHDIDLIAMPMRGLSRVRRIFTKSTTESVVRRSRCPVWTTADSRRYSASSGRIVCAISDTREAASLVRDADLLRCRLDEDLLLVYAVPELNEGTLARMSQDPPFLSVTAARRYLHTLAQSAGVQADCIADIGKELKVFGGAAKMNEADLLIVDQSKHSVALDIASLARRAGCPVLVTKGSFSKRTLHNVGRKRDFYFVEPAPTTTRRQKFAAG